MSKYQYPIDGQLGKTWKINGPMGWRIHPVKKTKKHHNGTDIGSPLKDPIYIEAFADGKVLKAQKSTAEGGGFGWYVVLQHKIDGEYYTSLYAHMVEGSLQVKAGQKVVAGSVLGKMGTSGMSTGRHLHWEIWKGKTHGWSADGKGFVEPVSFVKALIAADKAKSFSSEATPKDAPVVKSYSESAKPAAKAAAPKAAMPKKAIAKEIVDKPKPRVYTVISGDTLGKIAKANNTTVSLLQKINGIKNANAISIGQKIKLS